MKYPTSFISIDFETAYALRSSVISVGAVKFIDNKEVDSYYSLIQPDWNSLMQFENAISFEYVHGIADRELTDKPTFVEILPVLEKFCGNLPLVAHNATFEMSCFKALKELYGFETTIQCDYIYDTMKISKEVEQVLGLNIKGKGTHTLNTLCKMYGIPSGTHHNALDDSVDCGNMLVKMNEILDMSSDELANVHVVVPEPIIEKLAPVGSVELEELLIS